MATASVDRCKRVAAQNFDRHTGLVCYALEFVGSPGNALPISQLPIGAVPCIGVGEQSKWRNMHIAHLRSFKSTAVHLSFVHAARLLSTPRTPTESHVLGCRRVDMHQCQEAQEPCGESGVGLDGAARAWPGHRM